MKRRTVIFGALALSMTLFTACNKQEKKIQETAKQIYRALACKGFARVDLFLTPEQKLVFNEVNTIPGFTSHSRYPNMMKGIGMTFSEILERLIELEVR